METDEQIESDLQALARASTRGLPRLEDTARALAEARARSEGGFFLRTLKKPVWAGALAVAVAAVMLVFPVPYSRQRGFDVTIRHGDQIARLHLPGRAADRAAVEAHARALAHGGAVTLAPHVERVWGPVYAMAEEKLLHIEIDLQGKSAPEIEDAIKTQLAAQGWSLGDVEVERSADRTRVSISAESDDGRVMLVHQKTDGPAETLRIDSLDTGREPGMSDAELRQKILDELKARGLSGDVVVEDGKVQIRAEERVVRERP